MDTKGIKIREYNYELPDERIAKYPLAQRDSSKLLIYNKGEISQDTFRSLPQYLPQGALMVFNNTRVIQARLHFRKSTGALVEIFLLEPATPVEYQENFSTRGHCAWYCLVGNLKKWKESALQRETAIGGNTVRLSALRGEMHGTCHRIDFRWQGGCTFAEILEAAGELPIPPYLNRETEEADKSTYQTVYSRIQGSVAAPTAGLHFTDQVLTELDSRGIERQEVTLHVGAGTFKPVKSEHIGAHDMHTEHIAVRRETIQRLIAHGGKAIAVGTTSVRTLESLYYMGVMASRGEGNLHVPQWMPYEYRAQEPHPLTAVEALQALDRHMEHSDMEVLHASTQIIIAPGYDYHIVQMMVTNFHQPQSTLLLLVSAFVCGDWHRIYDYALKNEFRFLSYGDSSLLIPGEENSHEMLPIVDEAGQITGAANRKECHGGSMLLHPVVHLHVFNSQGELYLQKRPQWKDIQPGRWDTAVGGHVDLGESVRQALEREAGEELGIDISTMEVTPATAKENCPYVFQSERERELVFPYRITYDGEIHPSAETDGGKFWSIQEINDAIGRGILTPNFEREYKKMNHQNAE